MINIGDKEAEESLRYLYVHFERDDLKSVFVVFDIQECWQAQKDALIDRRKIASIGDIL